MSIRNGAISYTGKALLAISVIFLLIIVPRNSVAEEPEFEVNFSFGSTGINAQVYDSSTGEKIPKDEVEFSALPSGANSVDDVNRIKINAPGYQPTYTSSFTKLTMNMGFIKLVVIEIGRVELDPKQPPELTIYSSPSGASVYIDGDYKGRTPLRGHELDSGSHDVRLTEDGYYSWSDRVYVDTGESRTISSSEARLEKKNRPPTADFKVYPDNPSTKETVEFTSQSSDEDGRITDYHWEFGDGAEGWGESASHRYDSPGNYRIKLRVTDNDGASDYVTKTVSVKKANQPPSADFSYSPSEPGISSAVNFSNRSTDSDGYITETHWEFGDGATSNEQNPSHKYEDSGVYTVRLTVKDQFGATSSTSKQVTVRNSAPRAKFNFEPKRPKTGETVAFDPSASTDPEGMSLMNWEWRFGDGSTSNRKNPTHKYSDDGQYEVRLKVEDSGGKSDTAARELRVDNREPVASFNLSSEKLRANEEVTFDASASNDPDGEIKSYAWDLNGDGSFEEKGNQSKLSFKPTEAGEQSVSLKVIDEDGDSSVYSEKVKVLPRKQKEIDERHALVVGITEYQYGALNNLSFPAKDAQAFYKLLVDDSSGGFRKENVTLLTDEKATTDRIDDALSELVTEVSKDDMVVIYYSGHGAQGPDYDGDERDNRDEYYVTHNTDPSTEKSLYRTGYRDDQFANKIKSLATNRVAVFLDSCYSGGATKASKGYTLPGQKSIQNADLFSDFKDLEGKVLFAASQENQSSYEPNTEKLKKKFGHGIFTYYLLQGLRGEADKNEDGTITIAELRDYVSPQVKEFTEEHFSSAQVPKVKGNVSTPLFTQEQKLEGKVKYVKGSDKDKANQGEYVVIDLGNKDGVKKGDQFKVLYASKGVGIIEGLASEIEITDVVGPHLSVGRVTESGLTVEKGYRVRKMK